MAASKHDWNLILKNEGVDPIAPSCLRLLDSTLDAETTFRKFIDVMKDFYERVGYWSEEPRTKAYEAAGVCDLAVMNLIATHYKKRLTHDRLSTIFESNYDAEVIRRFIILSLAFDDSLTRVGLGGAILMVSNPSSQHFEKYPIGTEAGYLGQKALVEFIMQVTDAGTSLIKRRLFSRPEHARTGWFTDESLVELVLGNPDKVEQISSIVIERQRTDTDLIREVLAADAVAMSSGVL